MSDANVSSDEHVWIEDDRSVLYTSLPGDTPCKPLDGLSGTLYFPLAHADTMTSGGEFHVHYENGWRKVTVARPPVSKTYLLTIQAREWARPAFDSLLLDGVDRHAHRREGVVSFTTAELMPDESWGLFKKDELETLNNVLSGFIERNKSLRTPEGLEALRKLREKVQGMMRGTQP